MAFNLFKKNSKATSVFMNGFIYTQDPDYPWASAVACNGEHILSVGDYEVMGGIIDDETEIIDLNGKYMFPGFIDVHDTPVLKAFEDKYLHIDSNWDIDEILETLSYYCADNPENEVIFAYGYNEKILSNYSVDEGNALLDQLEETRPILILGESGVHIWLNQIASDFVNSEAEKDMIPNISISYILNLMVPFDFEEIENAVLEIQDSFTDKGFTTIFNMRSPLYFDQLYQNVLMELIPEEKAKLRFFNSLSINRPINDKTLLHLLNEGQTVCSEINEFLTFDFLKIVMSSDEKSSYFSQNALDTICATVADRGFNIHIDALDEEAVLKAYTTFDKLRNKGYTANTFVIATDITISKEILSDFAYTEQIQRTWESDDLCKSVFSYCRNTSDAIDNLTFIAADLLGVLDVLGTIEKGKLADFTVFEENPLEKSPLEFSKMHAEMTVINGMIIYDAEEEAKEDFYNIIVTQRL